MAQLEKSVPHKYEDLNSDPITSTEVEHAYNLLSGR